MKRFTFKTVKPTGKYKAFSNPDYLIKLDKKLVGHIASKYPFKIQLAVIKADIMEDGNPNCEWKWVFLKQESATLNDAKEFLNKNIELILEKCKLFSFDE